MYFAKNLVRTKVAVRKKLYLSFKERSLNRNTVGAVFPKYHEKQRFSYISLGTRIQRTVKKNALNTELEGFRVVGKKFVRTFLPRVYVPLRRFPTAETRKSALKRRLGEPLIIRSIMHDDAYVSFFFFFFSRQGQSKKQVERRAVVRYNFRTSADKSLIHDTISRSSDARSFANAIKVARARFLRFVADVRNNAPR